MYVGMLHSARARLGRLAPPDRKLIAVADALRGATALEPGGPSALFAEGGAIPVYSRLAALDVLDFSERTLWSQSQEETVFRERLIGEARRLDGIQDASYDAVLASHVLEHLADPLGALREWTRVVRPGGHVLLVLPHYEGTFDHRRPVTPVAHLLADAENSTGEDDTTHLSEVLELHDLERDPGAPSRAAFEQRCRENATTRAMHHHVFDSLSAFQAAAAAGLEPLALRARLPFDIVCLCRAGGDGSAALDGRGLRSSLRWSPFASDRAALSRARTAPPS